MTADLSGYTHTIFISYRQNDNRIGWVTEFVNALQDDLSATIKEPISIYFDVNPHDGLLETHNVDKSLEKHLNSLIFIPILSQTYCDPECFAWKHEFLPFCEQAKQQPIGLDVTLRNGNVASRILPVQIHEIDPEDQRLFEIQVGGVLRSITFIYGEAGVNRPLLMNEEFPHGNIHKTFYRNQINKVANAVKDILIGSSGNYTPQGESTSVSATPLKKESKVKTLLYGIGAILLLSLVAYLILQFNPIQQTDQPKSIAVLAFEDLSPTKEWEFFADGMTDEILNHLSKIGNLKVTSRTSSMKFRNTRLSVKEISNELNVTHVLEGTVRIVGDQVRIKVQLINGATDENIWIETYDQKLSNIFEIQSLVAREIARALRIELTPELVQRIESASTTNLKAYHSFLKARYQLYEQSNMDAATRHLEDAIAADPTYAAAYAELAFVWLNRGSYEGDKKPEEILYNVYTMLDKADSLDSDYPNTHVYKALAYLWFKRDFKAAEQEWNEFFRLNPDPTNWGPGYVDFLNATGHFNQASGLSSAILRNAPNSPTSWGTTGLSFYFAGRPHEAIRHYESALEKFNTPAIKADAARVFVYTAEYKKAITLLEPMANEMHKATSRDLGNLGIAYIHSNNNQQARAIISELDIRCQTTPVGSPCFYLAMCYTQSNRKDLAFDMLRKSIDKNEVELYWLKVEPPFKPLHSDERWKLLLADAGFELTNNHN